MADLPQTPQPRFDLTLPGTTPDAEGGRLPFRVLVIGDFNPGQSSDDYFNSTPVVISQRQFARVMAAQNLRLRVGLPLIELGARVQAWFEQAQVDLEIRSMDHFNPEMIVQSEPQLMAVHDALVRLRALQRNRSQGQVVLSDQHREDLRLLGLSDTDQAISSDVLEFLLTEVAEDLNRILNLIIHAPAFQQLESSWRGLEYLAGAVGEHPDCEICYLPADARWLADDLMRSAELSESHLFEMVYAAEYGQYGGRPYGVLLIDDSFKQTTEDIGLLRQLARLGQAAHAPVVAQLDPAFFGLDGFADLANLGTIRDQLASERYIQWRALQASPESLYLILTLPRILMRGLYSVDNGTVGSSVFEETLDLQEGGDYLWGNAGYGFASCLCRSFVEHGMCTDISGSEGGLIHPLPLVDLRHTREKLLPVEVLLSENKEAELIGLGFTPVSVAKADGQVLFHAANSVHWGHLAQGKHSLTEQVEAQLPYLFVVLRIAHHLKVIYRDLVGSVSSAADIEAQLNHWLKRYVSEVENPAQNVRLRRPLKSVALEVREDPERPDWLSIQLAIIPHMKYVDQDFALNLDFDLDLRR